MSENQRKFLEKLAKLCVEHGVNSISSEDGRITFYCSDANLSIRNYYGGEFSKVVVECGDIGFSGGDSDAES